MHGASSEYLFFAQVDDVRTSQIMLTLMLGASSAFSTPIGYQTNLMVLQPGGYTFGDFFKLGAPLTLIVGGCITLAVYLTPASYLP